MWGLYVDYSRSAVGHIMQCGGHICSGANANNVKFMYTSAFGHVIDCSDFINDVYIVTYLCHVDLK